MLKYSHKKEKRKYAAFLVITQIQLNFQVPISQYEHLQGLRCQIKPILTLVLFLVLIWNFDNICIEEARKFHHVLFFWNWKIILLKYKNSKIWCHLGDNPKHNFSCFFFCGCISATTCTIFKSFLDKVTGNFLNYLKGKNFSDLRNHGHYGIKMISKIKLYANISRNRCTLLKLLWSKFWFKIRFCI